MKEIQSGKKTHPMVEHFGEFHQGVQQEVLFRTVASFQTALQRQVWESVEIEAKTNSIGFHACLNHKTEWGASKDPALVPRKSPLSKTFPRAQFKDQKAGNTEKRAWMPPAPEPTRDHKRRRTEAGPSTQMEEGPAPEISPGRSRWERWQREASSPESPQEGRKRKRRRNNQRQLENDLPTVSSGLKGPSMLTNNTRLPNNEREGSYQERPVRTWRNKDRNKASGPSRQQSTSSQRTLPPDRSEEEKLN